MRTVAGRDDAGRCRTNVAAQLDAIGARQQRIGRWHQRIGAGRKTRHAVGNGDLAPDRRQAVARFLHDRRIDAGVTRDNGVDLVALRAVPIAGIGIDERRGQDIHRTAAARHEAGAGQLAATRQVEH